MTKVTEMQTPIFLLILLVLTLGLRHGLDLDHLATIDAISRQVAQNKRWQKLVGFLFSLGHGIVVILLSLIIGGELIQNKFPGWLDTLGSFVSIFFLLLFGLLNLINLFPKKIKSNRQPSGPKSYLTEKIIPKKCTPIFIIGIGALFALSFDTFTQVSLFSLSASTMSGWVFSGLLGLIFMTGMMITDGLNGLIVASLLQKANIQSITISRILGLAIAIFSLSICGYTIFKLLV